jgi:hypothetical protein
MMPVLAPPAVAGQPEARQVAAARGADRAAMPVVPFTRAAREQVQPIFDNSHALGVGSLGTGPHDIAPHGFMRHVVLLVEATGGAGSAAVAKADAPWDVLDEISLSDVNGNPIFGPVNGYELYLINKYGAYAYMTDPKLSPIYQAVQTNGNFAFLLRIPVEIAARDGLGALANQNASQTFKVRYSVSPRSRVYSTDPETTVPTLRVRAWLESWTQPGPTDLRGVPQAQQPPNHGTVQYWTRQNPANAAGQQAIRLSRVGNMLRNIIFIQRDSTGARVDNQFPDPITFMYDNALAESIGRQFHRHRMAERYGLSGAVGAANGLDVGVYVWDFTTWTGTPAMSCATCTCPRRRRPGWS